MSLPSYAVFKKDDVEVERIEINCGWVYEGDQSTLDVIKDLYLDTFGINKTIPEDYDTVRIYDAILPKEEVDFIIEKCLEAGIFKEKVTVCKICGDTGVMTIHHPIKEQRESEVTWCSCKIGTDAREALMETICKRGSKNGQWEQIPLEGLDEKVVDK